MAQIGIVGAGVAGLAAGRALTRAGHMVTIVEKSRGVGGRVATRRVAGFSIDHGAQMVRAPSAELLELVHETGSAHDLAAPVWIVDGAGRVISGDPAMNSEPKWVWPGGNTALAKHLAAGLSLRLETTVVAIRPTGAGYELIDAEDARIGPFDALLLTAPAPQSAGIIAASDLDANDRAALLAALQPVHYRPCLSLALAYPQRPEPPWYALVNLDRNHAISWLACEHAKPGRAPAGYGLMLAQMSPAWSQANWDLLAKGTYTPGGTFPAPAAEVHALVGALLDMDLEQPLWVDAHRWRYALADAAYDITVSSGRAGIFLAGDMEYGQGRVHLAITSGWAAARRIVAALAE